MFMNHLSEKNSGSPRKNQRGVTLIEVLITLLVLSIGLLGLAALQGFSLQAGQLSYLRTQANNIGYEVGDFARANRSIPSGALVTRLETLGDQLAAAQLPQGQVEIDFNDASNQLTIVVTWLDERDENGDDVASFEYETRI
jgi:type IV pilus assembly protein PilV